MLVHLNADRLSSSNRKAVLRNTIKRDLCEIASSCNLRAAGSYVVKGANDNEGKIEYAVHGPPDI
jgi:RNase P protein component